MSLSSNQEQIAIYVLDTTTRDHARRQNQLKDSNRPKDNIFDCSVHRPHFSWYTTVKTAYQKAFNFDMIIQVFSVS